MFNTFRLGASTIILLLILSGCYLFNPQQDPEANINATDTNDEILLHAGDGISDSQASDLLTAGEMDNDTNNKMMSDDKGITTQVNLNADTILESTQEDVIIETTIYSGTRLAGSDITPLLDFNKADYDKALNSDKLVVLYFYANWCPTCKKETANSLYPAFNELQNENVIGFRVNYNDNNTDKDEEGLARKFGVAYQHTKVFLKNGERILKAPDTWNKNRYRDEINKAL